ncbi:MAG: hypothetical protein ACM3O7_07640 [Acidobacteriota bacterium]
MKALRAAFVLSLLATAALAIPPSTDQYLASTGRVQGQCPGGVCALFRTDVWVFNPSTTQAANVQITFLPRDTDNTNPTTMTSVAVLPGQTKEYDDIFQSVFNLDGVVGALRVTSDIPVVATSRIYDVNVQTNKGTGTAGQFYPGLDAGLAIGSGQFTDIIGTAEDTTNWRTNLSICETTGQQVTLKIDRLDGSGAVVGTINNYVVRAREAKQLNSVLPMLGGTPAANQRLRVTPVSGSGRVLVTASRIDNRTGDPFSIEMTTPAVTAVHSTGLFEGVVQATDSAAVDGAIRVTMANGVAEVAALMGLPCGYIIDFDTSPNPPIALDGAGNFTLSLPGQDYTDGTSTVFTVNFTLTGQLSTGGAFTGALTTEVTGGTGDWAACNGTSSRNWRAGWVGSN